MEINLLIFINLLKTKLENFEFHPYISYGEINYRVDIDELYQYFEHEIKLAGYLAQFDANNVQNWEIETFEKTRCGYDVVAGFKLTKYIPISESQQEKQEEEQKNESIDKNDITDITDIPVVTFSSDDSSSEL